MNGILVGDLRLLVIRPTLEKIGLWSQAAENLLLGTAAHESLMGHYLRQQKGPALGIYQIEPQTHQDVWHHYLNYRKAMAGPIKQLVNSASDIPEDNELIINLAYATAIARIIYYRAPEKLPEADNVEGLASFWKKHYNTVAGKGSENEFITHYQQYVIVA